jgi:hypothetical protein
MNGIGTIRIKEDIMKKTKKMFVQIHKPLRVLAQPLTKVSSQSDE